MAGVESRRSSERTVSQQALLYLLGNRRHRGRSFVDELNAQKAALATCRMGHGPAMRAFLESWDLATPWLALFVWRLARDGNSRELHAEFPGKMPLDQGRSTAARDAAWLAALELDGTTQEALAARRDVNLETLRKGVQRARQRLDLPLQGRPVGRTELRGRNRPTRG